MDVNKEEFGSTVILLCIIYVISLVNYTQNRIKE